MPPPSAVLSTPSAKRRRRCGSGPFTPSTRLTCSNGRRGGDRAGGARARAWSPRARRRRGASSPVEEAVAAERACAPGDDRRRGRRCRPPRPPCCRGGSGAGRTARPGRGSAPRSTPSVPAIGRPSGASPQACSAKRLCTTSSGSSSCIAISSRITSRSASTSSAVISESVIMSPSTSTASGRSSSSTRAWKQVYSLAVNALNSPPTASSATEMSIADRSGCP